MAVRPVVAILTLGCKLNLADSEEIARTLQSAGFATVDHICEAEAFVVNTCSVTHVADAKSRRLVRGVRRMAPAATVVVTGCFPQSAGEAVALALGADFVVGTRDGGKAALVEFLSKNLALQGANQPVLAANTARPAGSAHARAFVKAQEGCNDVCAFCIVPQTRGREESRTVARVVAEVQAAVESGALEVVVTGTQLGAWGRDFAEPLKPHDLIEGILEETDVLRLRFSSLQPQDISLELLGLWEDPRLMPHFHLALQSGSDSVLQKMRRRYSAREFILAARRIRALAPDAAITTDVIAGFPGETAEQFDETLALCREVGFARLHCFPYSPRTRTAAARMPDQVSAEVRKERMGRLTALNNELSVAFRSRFLGTTRPVLWETERQSEDGTQWFGHTDNYIGVYATGNGLRNHVTPILLAALYHDGVGSSCPQEEP
ncbi:MAG: tRNA (N(6)-L-threonylcarbamoyladenosine(37)-C(2))-methylthiotransferase MtaB [Anaerolineaceae bacterium]